jgi:APA family basic amino acid/polyamine antiporter
MGPDRLEPGAPPRRLGLASATFLVVASMIGAGVFTTSGYSLAALGSPARVLAAWAVGGVAATCGALCYGGLARAIPESGGEYTFLARTLHPLAGFLAGWVSLLAGFTFPTAAAALILQAYLDSTFEIGGDPRWIGTVAILAAGTLHGLRLAPGVIAQNAVVVLKVALIGAFCMLGALRLPARGSLPVVDVPPLDPGAFAVTLVWISFAYSGWNGAVYVGGEVRDPERNLPRALLLGTLLVTLAYLALNAVFVLAAPVAELAGKAEVGAIAAEALGGPALRRFLTLIVALALFTSVSSLVMSGPRVYARMAADGVFPRFFGVTGDVPGRAVALQVALAIAVVWFAGLRELLGYIGFTLGLCAAAAVLGLVRLRAREGAERVRVPGWPLVPALFLSLTLFASVYMARREPRQALYGAATVALGLVPYFAWRRRQA